MSSGDSSSRSGHADDAAVNRLPAVDAFQSAFAAYLAHTVSVEQLRRVVTGCLHEAGYLARVMRDSFAAAFRARCLPDTDYRRLLADLPKSPRNDTVTIADARGAMHGRPIGLILPGRMLNTRYEIRESIATGGLGVLYKALDHRAIEAGDADCAVAVKVLNPTFRNSPDAVLSLRCEARNATRLAHPNIRQVYSLERCGADFFITMEWLQGESLATRLDRTGSRSMARPAAFQILHSVAAGLGHAHRRDVVHGDVKPANVFITTDGHVKLLDFGQLSALDAADVQLSRPAISPAYASCELHEGTRAEVRDDVFSLSVMAYRILAGARPFGGYTPLDAERAGIQVLRPRGLTAQQWSILQQGLAWRRSQRPDGVDEFMHALLPRHGLELRARSLIEAA